MLLLWLNAYAPYVGVFSVGKSETEGNRCPLAGIISASVSRRRGIGGRADVTHCQEKHSGSEGLIIWCIWIHSGFPLHFLEAVISPCTAILSAKGECESVHQKSAPIKLKEIFGANLVRRKFSKCFGWIGLSLWNCSLKNNNWQFSIPCNCNGHLFLFLSA